MRARNESILTLGSFSLALAAAASVGAAVLLSEGEPAVALAAAAPLFAGLFLLMNTLIRR